MHIEQGWAVGGVYCSGCACHGLNVQGIMKNSGEFGYWLCMSNLCWFLYSQSKHSIGKQILPPNQLYLFRIFAVTTLGLLCKERSVFMLDLLNWALLTTTMHRLRYVSWLPGQGPPHPSRLSRSRGTGRAETSTTCHLSIWICHNQIHIVKAQNVRALQ